MTTCLVCFSEFDQQHGNQKTCSETCKETHDRNTRLQRQINQKKMRKFKSLNAFLCTCKECGYEFPTVSTTQIVCQNKECRRRAQNKRQVRLNSNARKAVKAEDAKIVVNAKVLCKCPMCGKKHHVEMAPTNIMPRVFCPEHQQVAAFRSGCGFYQADYRCYAV